MAKIKKIIAREILDSRGIPSIEASLTLDNGNIVYRNIGLTNIYLKKDSELSIINPLSYYFENIKKWENLELILKNIHNDDNDSNIDIDNFFP